MNKKKYIIKHKILTLLDILRIILINFNINPTFVSKIIQKIGSQFIIYKK